MNIDEQGWCSAARRVESPNCDARAEAMAIDMVVIHNIHLPPLPAGATNFGGDDIERLFTNCLDVDAQPCYAELSLLRVSSHFLIRRDGELIQFVSCNQRAWHAGVSRWAERERCNDFSVGIELEGSDYVPFEAIQYDVLDGVLKALQQRYPLRFLVGHQEIAPERKTDPGPFFDWKRLEDQFGELRQSDAISKS
ncbi:1,6-anhydro-N-acetylmuramyl-L-alanine amidase AmpD [Chitinibacter bivalviorum]|uniref:1,6-anhydro-N-acetylmuramyl-L-alanine amidase AmpD n=1 Tax=Chitinibacter bivalviorum TaxID=2739434 RepID=A0A7H9BNA0_9NEIS|nr:1,6-anhydro-N-acetylmuramyl-L-alanine amidase AmpD [Chitinibacter bivalviorum]QLG89969.1 1,6-anhydro-N-acetylmuramyl-L-alanine amidase AmpD [Chitinibacter bivalviorum]